jgi:hypothetical protein
VGVYGSAAGFYGVGGRFEATAYNGTGLIASGGLEGYAAAFSGSVRTVRPGSIGGGTKITFDDAGDGVMYLYNADGEATIELDASEDADGLRGADVQLKNSLGVATIILDADYANSNVGRVITDVLEITGGSDLSEQFDITTSNEPPEAGMVVVIDPANPGQLTVSTRPYDRKVAGVISGANGIRPGMLMGQHDTAADGEYPVALTGRVWCHCDATNGSIQPGDLLTTSATPGHAMKVTDYGKAPGAIIGKAMTRLESDKGLVLVLVNLQ